MQSHRNLFVPLLLPRLLHLQPLVRIHLAQPLHRARRPANLHVSLSVRAESKVRSQIAARGIPHGIRHASRLRPACGFAAHLRPDRRPITVLPSQRNCNRCFCGLRFHHNSIRSPIVVTAASSLPSRSKSTNTTPRWTRGATNSFPTVSETSVNFPAHSERFDLAPALWHRARLPQQRGPATRRCPNPNPHPQPLH